MSLSSAAAAQAAALPPAAFLPPPVLVHRSVVIVAAGGRDLVWPQERIASALLQRSGGRPVHLLLHGGARGADRAIGRAAHQLGWRVQSLAADWRRYGRSAGPIRNRLLLEQALAEAQAHSRFPVCSPPARRRSRTGPGWIRTCSAPVAAGRSA
ncbi:MAG: SLOG family protein [Cyanobium sp.]